MDDLTRDQKFLLVSMYREMLRRKSDESFTSPVDYFVDSTSLIDLFSLPFSEDYVATLCWNLHNKGYLICHSGDTIADEILISDKTIVCMENRFKNGLKEVISFLSNFV